MRRLHLRWQDILLLLYLLAVLYITIFSREWIDLEESFILIPEYKYYLVRISWMPVVWKVVNNVLLFILFGMLLPLCIERIRWWRMMLIAFCFSAAIEITQLIFSLVQCELNDVLHNTFGAILGYGLSYLFFFIRKYFGCKVLISNTSYLQYGFRHNERLARSLWLHAAIG